MKRKIGLYGGTFNPLHFGHLNLAIELKEKKDLAEIWFVPAHVSPFRTQEPPLEAHHRLKMLELVLNDIEGFKICENELKRSGTSYTVDTVKEILKECSNDEFYLILGEDSVIRFHEWKDVFELINLVSLLIGSRGETDLVKRLPSLGFNEQLTQAIHRGITLTKQLEISSTEVRERLKKRVYCGHLIPAKILDYIYENQLYFNPIV